MTSGLVELFRQRIATGLRRKSAADPARWAEMYRVMGSPFPGPFSFKYHPWLKEMHTSKAPENCGQKSAQMGYTELLLNIAFFTNDISARDVLYVLPNKTPDASDFSASRFDAALELSPHLKNLYSDVKNVGHKRAGAANMYIRGSQAKAGLKSVPVGVLLLDEVEEMNQDNIPLAYERLSGQMDTLIWAISTPSICDHGINKIFTASSQEHFFFKCPGCSKFIEFKWPESLVITADDLDDPKINESHLICTECKKVLHHETKCEYLNTGIWVATFNGREENRGFHINQMYSSANAVAPPKLAKAFLKGKKDQTAEQEFYNSKMGLPHEVSGARISDGDLTACTGDHLSGRRNNNQLVTMGVDQGRVCHYEICEWHRGVFRGNDVNSQSFCKVLKAGTVQNFEDLDNLMSEYGVLMCVIDAHPERRAAFAFSQRFWGYVYMCFYGNGVNGKQIHVNNGEKNQPSSGQIVKGEPTITVDRTSWMDASLGRYKGEKKTISLPQDIGGEYKEHLKAPCRIYKEDANGNQVGRYVNDKADHYAHARNYSEIAFALAASAGGYQDIR